MLLVESLTTNHHVHSTPTTAMFSAKRTLTNCRSNFVWSVYLSSGLPTFGARNDFIPFFCILFLRSILATKLESDQTH